MKSLEKTIEEKYQKKQVAEVRSGDTVRVHQKIKEGNKERVQVFEGIVIRTKRRGSLTSSVTVRRITSGVGVEKSFLMHSPLIEKVEVVKRARVNRNNLSYMRQRAGKSARLNSVEFDRDQANQQAEEKLIEEVPEADTATAEADVDSNQSIEAPKEAREAEPTEKEGSKAEAQMTDASEAPDVKSEEDTKTTDQTKDA